MMPVRKSKTNANPAPTGERDEKAHAALPERSVLDDASFETLRAGVSNAGEPDLALRRADEHEVGLSAESIKLLVAGMDDVRSGRVRRIDPNEFDDE
jgi:hypothetical protein